VTCTGSYVTTQGDVSAGSVTNIARASGHDSFGDPITSADSTVSVRSMAPSMLITKAANGSVMATGDVLTYTVTVANTGPVAYGSGGVPLASFNDSFAGLTADATYVAGSAKATAGTVTASATGLAWSGPLGVSQTVTVTYQVRVNQPDNGPHVLENSITSSDPGSNCGPTASAGAAHCSTRTPVGDASVTKQVCGSQSASACSAGGAGPWGPTAAIPAGGTAYWKITVTNTGQVDLTGVTVNDPLVPACSAAAGTFSLPIGGSMTVYCSSQNLESGMTNVATASYPLHGTPPGEDPVTSMGGVATVTMVEPAKPAPVGPTAPPVTG
jgi:uncharacterized repeat protein (TIGR01451 family)